MAELEIHLFGAFQVLRGEDLVEHARRTGIPIDKAEIVQELEPSMFR